ncbi:MAG: hypothetical protein KDA42_10635 [Planctomycetales bacterium]|nr:hypothetical protein [Planctomycetales bacterium]
MIDAVRGCFGNQGLVDYRGAKRTLARFTEVLRTRAAITMAGPRAMHLHRGLLAVAGVVLGLELTSSVAKRQCRTWRGMRLAIAVVPVR